MQPGQVMPNALENAALLRIGEGAPSVLPFLKDLHVLSRTYTGVGCFTEFLCPGTPHTPRESPLGMTGMIRLRQVANGMGAVLWCRLGRPQCLELYTFGGDAWDGTFDKFEIEVPN